MQLRDKKGRQNTDNKIKRTQTVIKKRWMTE